MDKYPVVGPFSGDTVNLGDELRKSGVLSLTNDRAYMTVEKHGPVLGGERGADCDTGPFMLL